jgi:hypothetical protein
VAATRHRIHRKRRRIVRPHVELLEIRNLLSGVTGPLPSETLNQAKPLTPGQEVVGMLGNGPAGAADVDWYHFHLGVASDVILTTRNQAEGRSLVSVLSLYNSTEPYDPINLLGDFYDPMGYRLLAQRGGTPGAPDPTIERQLGPGDYYVAVSGAGNRYFHPFLAGCGYPGRTGDFALLVTANDLGLSQLPPEILAVDPAPVVSVPGQMPTYSESPLEIRLDLSNDLDPSFDVTQIQLLYNSTDPTFGAGTTPVSLNYNYSPLARELQLVPGAPFQPGNWAPGIALQPGYYEIAIATDGSGNLVLPNPNNLPLVFQVTGTGAHDTQSTAYDLQDVTRAGRVQVAGTIGTNFVDNATPFDPNDVNMYHFHVSGAGQYLITAEVFAGRIGSPLNAALSLYRLGSDGLLYFVAANADTTNRTVTVDGFSAPLYTDPELTAGLTAGDYYLAVSSGTNVPDPVYHLQSGVGGVFDPNVAHSGTLGDSTGDYLLNFLVQPYSGTPQVVSVTRDDGITPGGSPVRFIVQFNEPVNVQQLAFQAYQNYLQGGQNQIPAVFIQTAGDISNPGPGYNLYYVRLESYNPDTFQATFVLMNGLPTLLGGKYELHLSGPRGLTDLAGNPLAGSGPAGSDYVYSFAVNDPNRGPNTDPLRRTNTNPNVDPHNLGALFANELQAHVTINGTNFTGITITRPANPSATNTEDVYEIQVLYPQDYVFNLVPGGSFGGVLPVVSRDLAGLDLPPQQRQGGSNAWAVKATLTPGIYYVHIGRWTSTQSASVQYDLHISILGSPERPTALTIGPAPAVRIVVAAATAPPPVTPPSVPPPSGSPGSRGDTLSTSLLAFGLLGGNSGPANGELRNALPGLDVLDRVVAQAPRMLKAEEVLQLVSLFQALDATGGPAADDAASPPAANDTTSPLPFVPMGNNLMEYLYGLWVGGGEQLMDPLEPKFFNQEEKMNPAGPDEEVESISAEARDLALALCGAVAGLSLRIDGDAEEKKRRRTLADVRGRYSHSNDTESREN